MAETNDPTSITRAQAAVAKKVAKVMPEARIFEPKDKGTYYGPIVFADTKNVAQQVGEQTVVVHPRADMKLAVGEGDKAPTLKKGQVVSVKWDLAEDVGRSVPTLEAADPERWKERAARTPASEQHTKLARDVLGERFGVYNAPSAEAALSPRYEGVIAATTDSHLIQRINSRTAIVHAVGPELAQQYAAGQEVSVTYDNGKVRDVAEVARTNEQARTRPAPEREAPAQDDDKARARSFVLARNLVRQSHGPDAKLYNASRVDDQAGKFRGPIVSVTEHHAVQRVGNDGKFIVHDRSSLDGEVRAGRFVQIDYDKGKAQVKEAQTRQQQRTQQQSQSRAPARPAEDRSRNQGLSR